MSEGKRFVFAFGPFRLFPAERRLENQGKPVRIGGRALDLLIVLVERAGEVVSNRALIEKVWQDVSVEQSSLRFCVKNLRKALGDNQSGKQYVVNIPGRGYSFVASAERVDNIVAPPEGDMKLIARANLPSRESMIVGRSGSVETVCRELSKRRLVTVTGPGGIGKTSLAVVAAQALRSNFNNSVLFVDLAPIEDPSLVVSSLASVLGVALRADEPIPAILDFLRDQPLLIVLDNCEQVVEAVASLAEQILSGTVDTHLLVTSREPLRIRGEHLHRLLPLECPPNNDAITAAEAIAYPAVELFVDRATATMSHFSLDDKTAPAAAEICRRLDGIPLAIELAAARVEFFGVSGLARGITDMFAVLTQGHRFALPRHQTMRATIDWGYKLLSPIEQAVLRRVSVFRASFSLESALAVVGSQVSFENAIDAMANLVAKSLLTAASAGEFVQYRLLETTRLYATEMLASSSEEPQTARRHAELHLKLLQDTEGIWGSDRKERWIRRYAGRIDDVRAALDWCFSSEGDLSIGLDLITASARLWFELSLTLEYSERVERALRGLPKVSEPSAVMEMRLQVALGHALWYASSGGEADRIERAFTRALELADQIGSTSGQLQLQAMWGMWAVRRSRGQYRDALAIAEKYEAIASAADDKGFLLLGHRILGLTHHYLDNQAVARRLLEQVQQEARVARTPPNTDFQLGPEVATATMLSRVLWLQGFPDQAAATLQSAVDAAQEHWFSFYYVVCMAGCPLSLWTGNVAKAKSYVSAIANRAQSDQWRRCWTFILRLREGSERESLIASYLEPRLDLPTCREILALASAPSISVPPPNEDIGDALWSLPEVIRVNAELLLWRDGPEASAAAESRLLESLSLARRQSTLSWELRAAISLSRLWCRGGLANKARDLLSETYARFTEGFGTADLITARGLIAEWS